jgi:TPR repeat protein
MSFKKIINGLLLSLLLSSLTVCASSLLPTWDELSEGEVVKPLTAFLLGEHKTALAELTRLAKLGDADAQNNLADMYADGKGVIRNDKTALKWYTKAAEQGHAEAQFSLGFMNWAKGNRVATVKWFTKSAEQGHAQAQYYLGNIYDNGSGVLENNKTAVKWYTKAAKQGNADGQKALGISYYNGTGIPKNIKRAYMWVSLAAYNYKGLKYADAAKAGFASQMTSANISKAQDMSSRCLESNYTDC